MNHENGKSKAEAKLSTLAMLVECLMKYEGLKTTKALAIRTGRHERQIWKARAELSNMADAKCGTLPNKAVPNKTEQLPNEAGYKAAPFPPEKRKVPPCTPPKEKTNPPSPATLFFDPMASEAWFEKGTGRLRLSETQREFWVKQFGDEETLDLALIESENYVQENSNRSLMVQVSNQLARRAREKRDRDQRYEAARQKKQPDNTHNRERINELLSMVGGAPL
ncbi:MAG: hypothetical protein RIC14_00155 [Filomicrobium sp.]